MSQPKIDFASLRDRTVGLREARASAVAAAVQRRHARHLVRVRVARKAGGVGALVAVAAFVVLFLVRRPATLANHAVEASPSVLVPSSVPENPKDPSAVAKAEPAGSFGGVGMSDGSRVTFLAPGTELAQAGTTGRQSTLVRGAARFDVVHDVAVPFRVTAGSVVVEDVGTVFTVQLMEEGRTAVSVESGAVSVRGSDGERTLRAGESETFPVKSPGPAEGPTSEPHSSARTLAPRSSWQSWARAGDYGRAYAAIEGTNLHVRDDPAELLLASDSARLSGHPAQAVPLLRRLVDKFPSDSRAGSAAFTLGRVLLDDLGQPREAAKAFAIANAKGGPLAEDALVREVEAFSRAGDREKAKSTAARYFASYPAGRQAAYVQKLVEGP